MHSLTFRNLLRAVALCLTFVAMGIPCRGQSYGMSFSVYSDGYPSTDGLTLYMCSTVSDNSWGCSHSTYQNTRRLTSPSGRTNYTQSSSMNGSVSLSIAGEYGEYLGYTYGNYYCSCYRGFGGYGSIPISILLSISNGKYQWIGGSNPAASARYYACQGYGLHCTTMDLEPWQKPQGHYEWPAYLWMVTIDYRPGVLAPYFCFAVETHAETSCVP